MWCWLLVSNSRKCLPFVQSRFVRFIQALLWVSQACIGAVGWAFHGLTAEINRSIPNEVRLFLLRKLWNGSLQCLSRFALLPHMWTWLLLQCRTPNCLRHLRPWYIWKAHGHDSMWGLSILLFHVVLVLFISPRFSSSSLLHLCDTAINVGFPCV